MEERVVEERLVEERVVLTRSNNAEDRRTFTERLQAEPEAFRRMLLAGRHDTFIVTLDGGVFRLP